MKQSRSSSNSSSPPYASSSTSSLNSSTVESFQFSPWNGCMSEELLVSSSKSDHGLPPPLFSASQLLDRPPSPNDDAPVDIQDDCIYALPDHEQESPDSLRVEPHLARKWMDDGFITGGEQLSDAESSNGRGGGARQTLAELMSSSDKEEEMQSLLSSAPHRNSSGSTSQPTTKSSLLVQALCKGRRSTSSAASLNPGSKTLHSFSPSVPSPRVHNALQPRSKCSRAPSPLRKSSCCRTTSNQILDCTVVVRSKSSGSDDISRIREISSLENFLTKSKSLGAASQVVVRSNSMAKQQHPQHPQPLMMNRAGRSYSKVNNLPERCPSRNASSGKRSVSSSVNSSSNDSIIAAMERYQKSSKAEQKRRSSYLPYKRGLLSFFPIPWLWSQLRGGHHQHHHHHQQHSNVAY